MKLAAVGSNCVDFYQNVEGGKAYPGGGPVNMAVYTVRLGGEASYIGPVGNDDFGALMRRAVAEKGVDVSHLSVREGKTAVTQVSLIDGERVFGDYDEGVLSDYVLSEDDLSFICTHDMVICDLWGKVEGQFCDTGALREQMRDYHARGPRLVVAMLGEKGSLCFDGERFHSFGIVPCEKLVDTMGAGDSYIAGFLFGLVEGLPLEDCMAKGAANATVTLGYFGGW